MQLAIAQPSSRCMFYNVENLFDTHNDSLTLDDEFTPHSARAWSYKKYLAKLNHIFKVISAVGNPQPPDMVGLCEIENRQVLKDLLHKTPLRQAGYLIVQEESPDHRGIDVALLFNPKHISLLKHNAITLRFPFDSTKATRDILYAKLLWHEHDTLHLFVNHWPSRWGGALLTEPYRCHAASVLRQQCDSLLRQQPHARIIIMGDFNDYPTNKSMLQWLRAAAVPDSLHLCNLMHPMKMAGEGGTHKHMAEWGCLDQIIVSPACLGKPGQGAHVVGAKAHIFAPSFLLMPDKKYLGQKPFRTWQGYEYVAGFSDHLPIYIDIAP